TQTLVVFTKMFNKARDENGQQAEAEKKKLEKEALKEQAGANSSARKEVDSDGFAEIRNKLRHHHHYLSVEMLLPSLPLKSLSSIEDSNSFDSQIFDSVLRPTQIHPLHPLIDNLRIESQVTSPTRRRTLQPSSGICPPSSLSALCFGCFITSPPLKPLNFSGNMGPIGDPTVELTHRCGDFTGLLFESGLITMAAPRLSLGVTLSLHSLLRRIAHEDDGGLISPQSM
ncbi:unnamed protein product, partial [Ilex paraguariensis]